jgi:hypothetical protein
MDMIGRVRKEIESSLTKIGYEYRIDGNKITLDPNRLTDRTSSKLGKVRNFLSKTAARITVSKETEYLKEELFAGINKMITPIKLRLIGNLVFIFVYITILSIMLKHIWNHFFSTIAVSLFIVLISFMVFVSIQLFLDLKKSDAQILARGKFVEHNGKYEVEYDTFLSGLRRQKYWGILFSSILLAAFLSGILFNIALLNYISGVADSLGYIFAIVFLILSNPRKIPVAVLIFLFALFEIKNITNSSILDVIFLLFDAILYISFFIISWYDAFTFKGPANTTNRPGIS